ncbi:MAG: adenylate/guanylate cyclase domain-containing protein [Aestuariivirgaceae bacterium]
MERRLTTILAADVVGYTALMERDEAGTFDRLRQHRSELIEPAILKHHGRIFKLMGDGLLAEFASVMDAVECAVTLQRGLRERNEHVPQDQRIELRIGINLCEVIVEGDDRFGEGVNVAARLQQLADPGGICVSGKVAKEVAKKLAFTFEPMGDQKVKNIAEPVETYRIRFDGGPVKSAVRVRPPPWALVAAAMVALAALVLAGAWYLVPQSRQAATASTMPALAVLPFGNMSGDPKQDYLGAGIAEDIITALATFPAIRVVSRTSSFVYDKPVKVQQVADDLGVNYVVEGSVKRSGDKVRVTAQLINAVSGDHVWAERFDEEGDPLALQDAVATQVYNSIAGLTGQIRQDEERRAWGKAGIDLDEYDYYLRGHQLFMRWDAEDVAKARAIWREGLVKFPNSALLRVKLAASFCHNVLNENSKQPMADVAEMDRLLNEASALQLRTQLESWLFHWLSACRYRLQGKFPDAAREAELAVKLVPNDTLSHMDLADVLISAGKPERAIELAQAVFKRDPNGPDWWHNVLAYAYYNAGRIDDAVAELGRRKEPCKDCLVLAAAYARKDRLDAARKVIDTFRQKQPTYTVAEEARWPTGQIPQLAEPYLAAYLADLEKAGLPAK